MVVDKTILDQDVTNFLNSEEGRTLAGTTYHVAHIVLKNTENNEEGDKIAAELANSIVERARNGEDFATLASQYSTAQSAASGGNLARRFLDGHTPVGNVLLAADRVALTPAMDGFPQNQQDAH